MKGDSRTEAGTGERVITPPLGVDLCGYGFYLDRKAESVLDDLKARALVLRDDRTTIVIVGLDLVGLSVEVGDELRARIAEKLTIPRTHVLLACTHTHSGPVTLSLPGLGEMDAAYLETMKSAVVAAAEEAASSLRRAALSIAFEAIEPIGFDRRRKDFAGIDPVLKAAIIQTAERKIFLFNYACHAVVLGPEKRVSADWPGAVIRVLERKGHGGLFLQGFCGDVDPVSQWNRWGRGDEEDLAFYGDSVARRLLKAARYAERQENPALAASEIRLDLPLRVPTRPEIARQAAFFAKRYYQFPGGGRFAEEWKAVALARLDDLRKKPFLSGVPLQALRIGGLEILAWPGEIFSSFGLALRTKRPALMPVGYANGDVGYIPTARAFRDPSDYAAWCAPMFYAVFPFAADVGARLGRASRRLLGDLPPVRSPASV
jgi:hypothetical protein